MSSPNPNFLPKDSHPKAITLVVRTLTYELGVGAVSIQPITDGEIPLLKIKIFKP